MKECFLAGASGESEEGSAAVKLMPSKSKEPNAHTHTHTQRLTHAQRGQKVDKVKIF